MSYFYDISCSHQHVPVRPGQYQFKNWTIRAANTNSFLCIFGLYANTLIIPRSHSRCGYKTPRFSNGQHTLNCSSNSVTQLHVLMSRVERAATIAHSKPGSCYCAKRNCACMKDFVRDIHKSFPNICRCAAGTNSVINFGVWRSNRTNQCHLHSRNC